MKPTEDEAAGAGLTDSHGRTRMGRRTKRSSNVRSQEVSGGGLSKSWAQATDQFMCSLSREKETPERGVLTGFTALDKAAGGLHQGEVTVLAGRPTMGTSSLAMNIAKNVALGLTEDHRARPVGIFSFDWSIEDYVLKIACCHGEESPIVIEAGYASRESLDRVQTVAGRLRNAPLFVEDEAPLTIREVLVRAERMKRLSGVDLFVIDEAPLLASGVLPFQERDKSYRNHEQEQIARGLRLLAERLHVAVLVLSRISRDVETRKRGRGILRLEDVIYPSPGLFTSAVWVLRRPCRIAARSSGRTDPMLAILDVFRMPNHGEITSTVRLRFHEDSLRFESMGGCIKPNRKFGGVF